MSILDLSEQPLSQPNGNGESEIVLRHFYLGARHLSGDGISMLRC